MSHENVGTQGQDDPLGAPLLTIYNTSQGWLTLKNYDLVLYEHGVLIVLGLTLGNVGREQRRRREARRAGARGVGAHVPAGNAERSAKIVATPLSAILAADPGNRLVPLEEIESAALTRRLGICKLKLRLTEKTSLKFIWLNSSRMNASYDAVTKTLTDLLTGRLRAS
jgi:hypothetical protein